jgi:hypothetical protein
VAARDGSGMKRVSVRSDGSQTELASPADPAVSNGGREIAFASDDETVVDDDSNQDSDVFVHDRG